MNFYLRHIGDYVKDTYHLSLVEHGVFTLLLDRFYGSEKPITRQQAFEICRPMTKIEKKAVDRVLTDFFIDTKEGYINRRALREIEIFQEKSAKARQSALTRWKQNPAGKSSAPDTNVMRTHSERNADVMLSNNQYPVTNNQYPKSNNQKGNLIPIGELLAEKLKNESTKHRQ